MSSTQKAIVVLGLMALGVVVLVWAHEVGQVTVGRQSSFGTSTSWFGGQSPEAAAVNRTTINQTYGLYAFLTIAATTLIAFLADTVDLVGARPAGVVGDTKEAATKPSETGPPSGCSESAEPDVAGEIRRLRARIEELEKEREDGR